jgi:hypothetical protein
MRLDKILLVLMLFPNICFSDNEIWLQDTECAVVYSNFLKLTSISGSITTFSCTKTNNNVICSITSIIRTENMYGGKPAVVNSYTVLEEDNDIAIWQATTYDGQIILDLKDKRYITTQRTFLPDGLYNKNCVGEIKSY